jgi:hypothetical protein
MQLFNEESAIMIQADFLKDYNFDFNVASQQDHSYLVPSGSYARAQLKILGGGCIKKEDPVTKTLNIALYINVEFLLLDPPYAGRIISHMLGLQGLKNECFFESLWASEGRSMIRAIVESARCVHPSDASEEAKHARKLNSFDDLQGLICAIKVGLAYDPADKRKLRNKVSEIITPAHGMYPEIMGTRKS